MCQARYFHRKDLVGTHLYYYGHFSFLRFKKDKFHLGQRQTKTKQSVRDMEGL